ncbi:deleted in malignant brain tumors 1 protein-like [Gigantopelta aegis]|uniref:deleted in malignant brain tumors 1 protein-like n=1 Tax=Gigantopelta aegis TaxID=1735272 RepID=UPI001B88798F|nr:deleted in malignant brain tumors 1 protein-like [Gigantopelta aegis]
MSAEDIEVRIRGNHAMSGVVEIRDNSTDSWGTICADSWDNADATVICRMLGHMWGIGHTVNKNLQKDDSMPMLIQDVQCYGNETALGECPYAGWTVQFCWSFHLATVECTNQTVKLTPLHGMNSSMLHGAVEVRTAFGYQPVCDAGWNDVAANVVCRELGKAAGRALCCSKLSPYKPYIYTTYSALTNMSCSGTESSLVNCPHSSGSNLCPTGHVASAVCYDQPLKDVSMDYSIRLRGSGSTWWGTVEVRHLGIWGGLCIDSLDDDVSTVICKETGFAHGINFGRDVSVKTMPVWVTEVNCTTGNTTRLEQCVSSWGDPVRFCAGYNRVLCTKAVEDAPVVTLSNGTYGRVDITFAGKTGTICDVGWSGADAEVVCRQLGFSAGTALTGSYYGAGSGPVYLSDVNCRGRESKIWECKHAGWESQEQKCENHTRDASVVCHNGTVRLVAGDHSHGIVELWNGAVWYVLCGNHFSDTDAGVVCRQLGFPHGVKLPMASYATYYSMTYGQSVDCVGNETSITDCPVFSYKCVKKYNTEYAAVFCSNKQFTNELSFNIDGGGPSGDVVIVMDGLAGHICDLYWDDKDADVLCRQVGYTGGVAADFTSQSRRPFLLSEVHCDGTETSLGNCSMGAESCKLGNSLVFNQAGVFCYTNKAISLRLRGHTGRSGVVEIVSEQKVGTVCESHQTTIAENNAAVVCKQLGFNTGIPSRAYGHGTGDVMLVSPQCQGSEPTLWMCSSDGWGPGSVTPKCRNHSLDMGVVCFKHVQLTGGSLSPNKSVGFVSVFQEGSWRLACAQDFTSREATVVCRELGFEHVQLLPGLADYAFYTYNILCKGSEKDLGSCDVKQSRNYHCDYSYRHAYVSCSASPFSDEITALSGDTHPTMAIFSKYDQNVTVCSKNWSDASAGVACLERGYRYGYAFGARLNVKPTALMEFNISCYGNESSINECHIGTLQSRSKCSVGWLVCSNKELDPKLRLVDNTSQPTTSNKGRLEIRVNGTWGRVCDRHWTTEDAKVVCRQMGFLDGQPLTVSGGGSHGPVWLQTVQCSGSESSLFKCPNTGLGFTSCRGDVGVTCTGTVRLQPNAAFGTVQIYNDDESNYNLICADHFDDIDAHVICRQLHFLYGIKMCCSAFGPPLYRIGVTKLQCTGNDIRVQSCQQETSLTYCPSRKYAAVVCSDTSPNTGYAIHLSNGHFGVVQVEYMNRQGLICSDGFDNKDARVICREKGFSDGIGYTAWDAMVNSKLRWLSNLNCTGNELYLSRCTPLLFGDLSNCSNRGVAAVMCFKNESQGLEVRLTNQSVVEGGVEVAVDGKWGLICDRYFDDGDANVLCRMMGYVGGIESRRTFHTLPMLSWTFSDLRCGGDEQSILQCPLDYLARASCPSGKPASVKCYQTVRLTPDKPGHYGRVEMYTNNMWVAVCDNNFNDNTALVVCRQLGFVDGRAQCCSAYGPVDTPIDVTLSSCLGSEKDVFDCGYSSGMCKAQTYASVFCSNASLTKQGVQVKLKYPVYHYYGTIHLNVYGYWGPVCDTLWNDKAASVACRQMGWAGGAATRGSRLRNLAVLVDTVACTGTERHLNACRIDTFQSCASNSTVSAVTLPAAGVLCYNKGIGIRLAGGNSFHGRVEVGYDGQWGVVCDVSGKFATVACRQLGFQNGVISYSRRECFFCSKHLMMGNVNCSGLEDSVWRCKHDWYNSISYCGSVHVKCWNSVYLTEGSSANEGQVFVDKNGTVGAVCADGWSAENTKVTCQELGFTDGYAMCCGLFRRTEPKFYNFRCTGSEKRLTNCPHTSHSFETCKSNTVAVACYTKTPSTDFKWTLAGGSRYGGEIQVNFMHITGKVCPDGWTDMDSRVACRELGFVNGSSYTHYLASRSTPYWTSSVICTGNEERLADCQMAELGSVKMCHTRHSVGIVCYDKSDVFFWISDGSNNNSSSSSSSSNSGRLDVAVDGQWGTVCSLYFRMTSAIVACRGLGYTTGSMTSKPSTSAGPSYKTTYMCGGHEKQLSECPHQGLSPSMLARCSSHKHDVYLECVGNLKLGTAIFKNQMQGPVQYNYKGMWYPVCDTDFTDVTAKRVCQDLGFSDGKALCCSAFVRSRLKDELGLGVEPTLTLNISMVCEGGELSVAECVKVGGCRRDAYASVVCLNSTEPATSEYQFSFANGSADRQGISVKQFGIQGRICNTLWDDRDATVFCRGQGYRNGIAYHYQALYLESINNPAPYWVSGFNCSGEEADLTSCPFNDRLSLGNCQTANQAAALCFNKTTEIKYRLAGGDNSSYGRVEVNVDGVWGSVCDQLWDDREAGVLCRQLGFHDGYALPRAHYGMGMGPVWLSYLSCQGTESSLHQCPHSGFHNRIASTGPSSDVCSTHSHDASVACIKDVRLSEGRNAAQGAVEIYTHGQWAAVCDDNFDTNAATVVCRVLGFTNGIPLVGSRFGNISNVIGVMSMQCTGSEETITACRLVLSGQCVSGMYISVTCQNEPVLDNGFQLRISKSPNSTPYSGMIEVKHKGIWGAVCMPLFDDIDATVACRQLGFSAGIAYRAPGLDNFVLYSPDDEKNNSPPVMMMWNVSCQGEETSLDQCEHGNDPTIDQCSYGQARAGVICYNNSGIRFQLVHGTDKDQGILEMDYDGQKGYVCDLLKSKTIPKVACRSMGFSDGLNKLPQSTPTTTTADLTFWFSTVLCRGDETSIARCRNDGFSKGIRPNPFHSVCRRRRAFLSVHCFHQPVAITKIRLADGSAGDRGRVEVYLQGPNQWGTVCDSLWNDRDATVVCRQMGYSEGTALRGAAFGPGTGPVWLSSLSCNGTEIDITKCRYHGFWVTKCNHYQDASVICQGLLNTSSTTTTAMSTSTTMTTSTPFSMTSPEHKTDTNSPTDISSTVSTLLTSTETSQGRSGNEAVDSRVLVPAIVVPLILLLFGITGVVCYRRNRSRTVALKRVPLSDSHPISELPGGPVQLEGEAAVYFAGRDNDEIGFSNPLYGKDEFLN